MILKKDFLQILQKKYSHSIHGIDYLVFNFDSYFFHRLKTNSLDYFSKFLENSQKVLNTTNSNSITFDFAGLSFSVQKMKFSQGIASIFSLSLLDTVVPFLMFYEYDETKKGNIKYSYQIHFYGTFFATHYANFHQLFFPFINSCFLVKGILSRVDVKLDLFTSNYVNELLPASDIFSKLDPRVELKEFRPGGLLQSWSYGSKKSGRKIFRFYNKFRDNERRGLHFLYPGAYNFRVFHRFEIQLMYKEVNSISSFQELNIFVDSYATGLQSINISNSIEYIKDNPCIIQVTNSLTRVLRTIKNANFPMHEILIDSLRNIGYTQKEVSELLLLSECHSQLELDLDYKLDIMPAIKE